MPVHFRVVFLFLAGCVVPISAVSANEFRAGEHYEVLDKPLPQGVAPVTEFFYYGCRACYQLADAIAAWSHESGNTVGLVPAHSETALVDGARLYHSLAAIGRLDLYKHGFILFQTENSDLQGKDRINAFLDDRGIEREVFWRAWGGEKVARRLSGSLMLTRAAGVVNTPSFVVHGVYKVDTAVIKSVDELFELLEHLVNLGSAEGA